MSAHSSIAVKFRFCLKVLPFLPEKQIGKSRANIFGVKRNRFLRATCKEIITCYPDLEVAAEFSRNFNEAM